MMDHRTIDDYKKAGAWMRLLKGVLSETWIACSRVMKAKDYDKFRTIENKINSLCSKAEENMFNDYPTLNNDWLNCFYGDVGYSPLREGVDTDQVELAQKLIKELFRDNWK